MFIDALVADFNNFNFGALNRGNSRKSHAKKVGLLIGAEKVDLLRYLILVDLGHRIHLKIYQHLYTPCTVHRCRNIQTHTHT